MEETFIGPLSQQQAVSTGGGVWNTRQMGASKDIKAYP
jgi:hypothetical protein